MNGLLVLGATGGAVALAVVAYEFGKRLQPSARGLKDYYRRLGQAAPGDPCPCGKSAQAGVTYAECCRKRDLELLEQEVKAFVWNEWSRRSAGRSKMRPMKDRLADFPMSACSIPEWVSEPERFTFPIPEETLRSWTPVAPEDNADFTMMGSGDDAIPL
ncbi:MAG: hypothetical protein H6817_09340 [Phycisphaerales bacterium]|nr:hypothetical protein [Phycisphaerales bacterium]